MRTSKAKPNPKIKKVKKYLGRLPTARTWIKIGELNDGRTIIKWHLYIAEPFKDKNFEWSNYRLIATRPIECKANFSLSWNSETKRIYGSDYEIISTHHLCLFDQFLEITGLTPNLDSFTV